jgi:hypothetical protein
MKFLLLLTAAVLASCASIPLIGDLSPLAGERAAHRDIAAGHLKIFIAGTEAAMEVGVGPADRKLVDELPRDRSLPIGCVTPNASESVEYARAYNLQIVRYLRSHPKRSEN